MARPIASSFRRLGEEDVESRGERPLPVVGLPVARQRHQPHRCAGRLANRARNLLGQEHRACAGVRHR